MADYIERQAAIDAFNRIKNTLKNPETAHYDTLMFYEIEDVLEDVEPADVASVVRCDDCVYYGSRRWCELHSSVFDDNAFCSYGEKREE